jgi:small subunit ribosomal protein S20
VAHHKSAKKRARQSLKRHARNRRARGGIKTAVKKVRAAVTAGDGEAARQAVPEAEGLIRRAASKGVIPRARANRQISRLARAAHQAQS